jgi:cytoskeletal protein CcmA (bactofilin family)
MAQTLRISKGDYNIATSTTANVIFTTGNVAIGTSNALKPDAELTIFGNPQTVAYPLTGSSLTAGTDLHISGADGAITRLTQDSFGTSTYVAFTGRNARGTAAAPSQTLTGDTLTQYTARGFSNGSLQFGTSSTGLLSVMADGNFTDTSRPTKVVIYTTTSGSITPAVAATFESNGNLTVNALTVNNSMTIGTTLNVTGNVILGGNLGVDGGTVTIFDSILDLHTYSNLAPWTFDDGKDIGIRMHYNKGSDTLAFLGLENTTNSLQFLVAATETSSNITGTFGNVQFGTLLLSNTAISANTTSGALIVTGGAGIGGNVNAGNVTTTGTLYGNAAAGATGTTSNAVGYLGMPQNSQNANYTLALIDQGKHVYVTANSNVTIPANASVSFPIGSTISVINAANIQCNISITTDTLYLAANGATGTRNLSSYGMATLVKVANTVWYINGSGVS